ncbi:MAG: hydantoinase B/oxoprolinase family protein [Proteobacteria bacterium]|nr:hydantoinase B/oxoprolinase family protein [Pseudomonadota bacterium]
MNSDPTRFSVLARRLDGIVHKMQATLMRTSRSGVISSGHDCSCCLLSANSELVAVADSIPIHVMVGPDIMSQAMHEHHAELKRGDAFLHNSPYHGNSHAADLSILVPVIDDDRIHRFTVLTKAHQADIGNASPTTYMPTARDIYEEGALLFPAVKVQENYETIEDIVRMCRLRIRVPEQWHGDFLALLGAARVGERELLVLGREIGWAALEDYIVAWLDYGETMMAGAISKLPAGRASAETRHDHFPGTPEGGITIRATVEIDPEERRIAVDLTDNVDCLPCGLNLSEACSRSAALVGLFNGLGSDIPPNAGSFRRVDVTLRENCVVGIPRHPTSCSVATTNVADRLANAVQCAMAKIADGIGLAEAGAIEGPGGAVISGNDPRYGNKPFVNQLALGDTGGPAGPGEDGWLTLGNVCTAGFWLMDSVEIDELNHPLLVHERRLVPDTEGAGRYRGAPACRMQLGSNGAEIRLIYASDGTQNPAQGVRGGGAGARASQWIKRGDGRTEILPGVGDVVIAPDDMIVCETCGGGGYGPPLERDPKRVERDVAAGLVTTGRALSVYGVVLHQDGEVDESATTGLRQKAKAACRPGDNVHGAGQ